MEGIAIGLAAFLLLRFAGQMIHLLYLLGVLLVQIFLLLVVDGPYARTRYALVFGLARRQRAVAPVRGPPIIAKGSADAAVCCVGRSCWN